MNSNMSMQISSCDSQNEITKAKPIPLTYMFNGTDSEILRLEPNGDIYVHGKLIENDKEVVEGMRYLIEVGGINNGWVSKGINNWNCKRTKA